MPDKRVAMRGITGHAIVTEQGGWKAGEPFTGADHDYLGWHAWAEVQHKAGLRQKACGSCGKWKYPQELGEKKSIFKGFTRKGERVTVEEPLCLKCSAAVDSRSAKG